MKYCATASVLKTVVYGPPLSKCLPQSFHSNTTNAELFLEAQEEDLFSSINFFNVLFMKKAELKAFYFISVKMKLRIGNLYRKACRGSFLTPPLASIGVVHASTVVLS